MPVREPRNRWKTTRRRTGPDNHLRDSYNRYIHDPTKAYLRKIGAKGRKEITGAPAQRPVPRKAAKARSAKAEQKKQRNRDEHLNTSRVQRSGWRDLFRDTPFRSPNAGLLRPFLLGTGLYLSDHEAGNRNQRHAATNRSALALSKPIAGKSKWIFPGKCSAP